MDGMLIILGLGGLCPKLGIDDENLISYPEDLGWSVGGQLGFYGYQKNSFFNMLLIIQQALIIILL